MPSAISMDRPPYPSGHTVLNRRAWTAEEDMLLTQCVKINGEARWTSIPRKTGLKRSGKSCRLRWLNYLRPDIKHGHISSDEEELIIRMHRLLGNRWALIAGRLPGRTDNEIKNYWNAHLAKKSLSNNKFRPKSETKVKHASSAVDGLLKVTPVKAKALRIAKDWNKHVGSGSSNDQTTDNAQTVNASNTDGFDLSLEELMTDHHSGIIDFRTAAELESPSVGINRQYSLEDFRIDEFQASPSYYMEMSSLYNNMEKFENFTDADYQEMDGIYGSKQHSDWVDEL